MVSSCMDRFAHRSSGRSFSSSPKIQGKGRIRFIIGSCSKSRHDGPIHKRETKPSSPMFHPLRVSCLSTIWPPKIPPMPRPSPNISTEPKTFPIMHKNRVRIPQPLSPRPDTRSNTVHRSSPHPLYKPSPQSHRLKQAHIDSIVRLRSPRA